LHNPKTSIDNIKNETINHHCTTKDISSAHLKTRERQVPAVADSLWPPRGGGGQGRGKSTPPPCAMGQMRRCGAPPAIKAGEPDPHTYPTPIMARRASTGEKGLSQAHTSVESSLTPHQRGRKGSLIICSCNATCRQHV